MIIKLYIYDVFSEMEIYCKHLPRTWSDIFYYLHYELMVESINNEALVKVVEDMTLTFMHMHYLENMMENHI